MRDIWRRLTGQRTPKKQAEFEHLERARIASRQHRERSQTRLDESLSRVRRLIDEHGLKIEPDLSGRHDNGHGAAD